MHFSATGFVHFLFCLYVCLFLLFSRMRLAHSLRSKHSTTRSVMNKQVDSRFSPAWVFRRSKRQNENATKLKWDPPSDSEPVSWIIHAFLNFAPVNQKSTTTQKKKRDYKIRRTRQRSACVYIMDHSLSASLVQHPDCNLKSVLIKRSPGRST